MKTSKSSSTQKTSKSAKQNASRNLSAVGKKAPNSKSLGRAADGSARNSDLQDNRGIDESQPGQGAESNGVNDRDSSGNTPKQDGKQESSYDASNNMRGATYPNSRNTGKENRFGQSSDADVREFGASYGGRDNPDTRRGYQDGNMNRDYDKVTSGNFRSENDSESRDLSTNSRGGYGSRGLESDVDFNDSNNSRRDDSDQESRPDSDKENSSRRTTASRKR